MKKICVITGSRAEYGLLQPLMKGIKDHPELFLQTIATGTHLLQEFGNTVDEIRKDGFSVDKEIDILLSNDSPEGVSKSMGLAQLGYAEAFKEFKPDLLVLLGDRFEILPAASTALIFQIPIAHIHGGEVTLGAFDDGIRHAITKMSHYHFTSTESYRKRIIQMGEVPQTVFNVGSLGVESMGQIPLLSKSELETELDISFSSRNLLIAFHPATRDVSDSSAQFQEVLNSLDALEDTTLIFTKSNADPRGRALNALMENFSAKNPEKRKVFPSLGQKRFYSLMRQVDAIVGNSSSGIIESSTYKVGCINIGSRQEGREQADNTINCQATEASLTEALQTLYSTSFQDNLSTVANPYSQGSTAEKILGILYEKLNTKKSLQKAFYDLEELACLSN